MGNYTFLLVILPIFWWAQGWRNVRLGKGSSQPPGSFICSHVGFPPHCHWGHVEDHHMAPSGPIWLHLPKRGAQEHKNAAVYFYCSPFSFSSICLPYGLWTLWGSRTHRPLIMRVANLTKIKAGIHLCHWRGAYVTYLIYLILKLLIATFLQFAPLIYFSLYSCIYINSINKIHMCYIWSLEEPHAPSTPLLSMYQSLFPKLTFKFL